MKKSFITCYNSPCYLVCAFLHDISCVVRTDREQGKTPSVNFLSGGTAEYEDYTGP